MKEQSKVKALVNMCVVERVKDKNTGGLVLVSNFAPLE